MGKNDKKETKFINRKVSQRVSLPGKQRVTVLSSPKRASLPTMKITSAKVPIKRVGVKASPVRKKPAKQKKKVTKRRKNPCIDKNKKQCVGYCEWKMMQGSKRKYGRCQPKGRACGVHRKKDCKAPHCMWERRTPASGKKYSVCARKMAKTAEDAVTPKPRKMPKRQTL